MKNWSQLIWRFDMDQGKITLKEYWSSRNYKSKNRKTDGKRNFVPNIYPSKYFNNKTGKYFTRLRDDKIVKYSRFRGYSNRNGERNC